MMPTIRTPKCLYAVTIQTARNEALAHAGGGFLEDPSHDADPIWSLPEPEVIAVADRFQPFGALSSHLAIAVLDPISPRGLLFCYALATVGRFEVGLVHDDDADDE